MSVAVGLEVPVQAARRTISRHQAPDALAGTALVLTPILQAVDLC